MCEPAGGDRGTRPWLQAYLAIACLALSLRLLHLWQIRQAPFFSLLLGDSQSYDAWAVRIASGDWLGSEVFYQAPLYPYVLGVVYAVLGRDLLLVRILQVVLGAASCVMLAEAGRRFFGSRTGLAAGIFLACYPPAIFFDARVDKSSLDVFLLCCGLGLVGALVDDPRPRLYWVTGVAFGALALTRENALSLIVALILWMIVSGRSRPRRLATIVPLFLVGLLTVLAPVAVRNLVIGGEVQLTTSQLGPNFFIGNNPEATGTYRPLRQGRGSWRHERQDATELAQLASGRELKPAEVSRFWTARALDYIRSEPLDWLRGKALTLVLLCNSVEVGDTEDQYSHADHSVVLRLLGPILHFGALAPLALAGAWFTWNRRKRLAPLYLLTAAYAASVVLFYVLARYRHPLAPLLMLFAAAALVGARRWWRDSSRKSRAACLVATGIAALFCNWPTLPHDGMRAVTELNVANALETQGDIDGSIHHLQRALILRPDFDIAHYNLGNMLGARGKLDEAVEHYREAVRIRDDYAEAYNNWGMVLLNRRRFGEAQALFARVLELDPAAVPALYNLATVRRLQGDFDGAVDLYRRVLEQRPDHESARNDLEALMNSR